ncbi:MAG: hypothetical protein Q4G70_07545 [Pseudomonadota bacterium]|nr:hypothetical protein [Pseudomonadota bacterium]
MKSGFHDSDFHGSDDVHPLGERAMHLIAPRWPCHAARSGASNRRFQVE